MRLPIIAGAQKLFLDLDESIDFAEGLIARLGDRPLPFEVAVCPSLVNFAHVAHVLRNTRVLVGAQNVHQEDSGAFTGQVSIKELIAIGATHVIIGHSELRQHQNEDNKSVNRKLRTCLNTNITPIVCLGESRDDRARDLWQAALANDLREIFHDVDQRDGVLRVIVAYEPVWAIRAGKSDKTTAAATPAQASTTLAFLRNLLGDMYSRSIADQMRIIYGGSVDPDNTNALLSSDEIDGLLVGTSSVKLDSFLRILREAELTILARSEAESMRHAPVP